MPDEIISLRQRLRWIPNRPKVALADTLYSVEEILSQLVSFCCGLNSFKNPGSRSAGALIEAVWSLRGSYRGGYRFPISMQTLL